MFFFSQATVTRGRIGARVASALRGRHVGLVRRRRRRDPRARGAVGAAGRKRPARRLVRPPGARRPAVGARAGARHARARRARPHRRRILPRAVGAGPPRPGRARAVARAGGHAARRARREARGRLRGTAVHAEPPRRRAAARGDDGVARAAVGHARHPRDAPSTRRRAALRRHVVRHGRALRSGEELALCRSDRARQLPSAQRATAHRVLRGPHVRARTRAQRLRVHVGGDAGQPEGHPARLPTDGRARVRGLQPGWSPRHDAAARRRPDAASRQARAAAPVPDAQRPSPPGVPRVVGGAGRAAVPRADPPGRAGAARHPARGPALRLGRLHGAQVPARRRRRARVHRRHGAAPRAVHAVLCARRPPRDPRPLRTGAAAADAGAPRRRDAGRRLRRTGEHPRVPAALRAGAGADVRVHALRPARTRPAARRSPRACHRRLPLSPPSLATSSSPSGA